MLKKTLLIISVPISFIYLKAQDVSVLRNTVDAYSNSANNGSSRYNSMAGSMGALGGDISSNDVNPAGLGVYIASDVNLTLGINNNKNATTLHGKSVNYSINKTDINHISGVLAFTINDSSKWKFVNLGVNYSYRSLEDYTESPGNQNVKIVDDYSFEDPITYSYLGHGYDRYGDISKTNVSVAANYDNRIYLGLGLNFHDLYINQFDTALFHSSYDNTSLAYNKQYTDYEERSNGFSANIGIIAKVTNTIRLGAAIETPTWWNLDRTYMQYYFNNSNTDLFREDRTLTTPLKGSLSAAFVPNKNFAINVDYIQGLTKPSYKKQGAAERELDSFISDNYKNSSEVRIGAEYRLNAFRLRAGYGYQNSPFNDVRMLAYNNNGDAVNTKYSNLILGSRSTLGLGVGYDFRAFYLDVAYQNITSDYKSPFLYGNADNYSGYFNHGFDVNSDASLVSDVKNKRNNISVTLGWRF